MYRNVLLTVALGSWLAAVGVGMGCLLGYEFAAAPAATAPAHWPVESRLPLPDGQKALVVFAHPRCPCTKASLDDLKTVLGRCAGRVTCHVVFVQPSGCTDAWSETGLWHDASQMKDIHVHRDRGGVEARRFGATTSGQTLLFDPAGALRYSGGITGSRGHAGENAGRNAVIAWINDGTARFSTAPVFGCSLLGDDGEGKGDRP